MTTAPAAGAGPMDRPIGQFEILVHVRDDAPGAGTPSARAGRERPSASLALLVGAQNSQVGGELGFGTSVR
ncbi:hypothetical protein ACIQV3_08220 [Streptomyces sp. NPDC099050]|uniref:hypothetical protein n=1 Tax=Streptomyces sp. NPDC099050 TaxID=3366100 RepID=UPI00382A713E